MLGTNMDDRLFYSFINSLAVFSDYDAFPCPNMPFILHSILTVASTVPKLEMLQSLVAGVRSECEL
jgi:hypothetical protein